MPNKQAPIAILGSGAWGLSTALHLNHSGYTDITVFERAEEIPSQCSAAYDLNKIVRAEYEDSFYTELALVSSGILPTQLEKMCLDITFRTGSDTDFRLIFFLAITQEAIEAWKSPLFDPYYHQTGYIVATTGKAPQKAIDHLEKALESISSHPVFASGIRPLKTGKAFKDHAWQFSGPLTGFKGYFNKLAGYAHSSDALRGIWLHCAAKGVKFITGELARSSS
jgi:sarcosine oxidase / L-pipecolate oxidase